MEYRPTGPEITGCRRSLKRRSERTDVLRMTTSGDRSAVRAPGVPAARAGSDPANVDAGPAFVPPGLDSLAGQTAGQAVGQAAGQTQEQVLEHSERTRIVRVRTTGPDGTGESVIRKEMLGPDGMSRARREAEVLEQLRGVDGVSHLQAGPNGPALIVEDVAGQTLAERLAAVTPAGSGLTDLAVVLDLSIGLAEVLTQVHSRGVVHRDLNPVNIVLREVSEAPVLIDFELAGLITDERPARARSGVIVGTLAYLAPEQTGRTGHAVDQRADLYALGATLYELVTGRTPFGRGEDDALGLIHDHLARVPAPVRELVPTLPQTLSDVIARLLEKEPDRRYQSAAGLAHDLVRLRAAPTETFGLGDRDFPLRLTAPAGVVARGAELDILASTFADTVAGHGRGLLITGEPGVGKSVLLDELRPIVTAAGGWLVAGAFGQNSQDRGSDAVIQAMRSLGRLMLAEPEAALAAHRKSLLSMLGGRACVMAAIMPEYELLLGVGPQLPSGDALQVQSQIHQIMLDILRLLAATRPLVIVLDDLQWAGTFPLGMIDVLLTAPDLPGLLLAGAYRDAEVVPGRPFAEMLARWNRLEVAPPRLRVRNLPADGLSELLGVILRIPPEEASRLSIAIGARTGGNPYDTIELLNALREEGALVPGASGWSWDPVTIRRHVGRREVVDLLAARISRLPGPASALLEVLACLGGRAAPSLLAAAAALTMATLDEDLAPSIDDGLLILDTGTALDDDILRFRHDRLREVAYQRLQPSSGAALHLRIARRLAKDSATDAIAAEQYLQALSLVTEPGESRRVADLFQRAALTSRVTDPVAAERYLAAAVDLLGSVATVTDQVTLTALEIERHTALFSLGQLGQTDDLYRSIERRCPDPIDLAAAAGVQIASLTNRTRPRDALTLGLALLARLGIAVPAPDQFATAIQAGQDELRAWIEEDDRVGDRRRPENEDPRMVAVAGIINRLMPPSYFCDHLIMAWLVLESRRMWAEHGPCRGLIGPLGYAGLVTIGLTEDYRAARQVGQRVLAAAVERDYELESSRARIHFAAGAGHWFEPIEDVLEQAKLARDGLLEGGDLQTAVFSSHVLTPSRLDCASTLESYLPTVEAGLALAVRTGNEQAFAAGLPYRQFVRALRRETEVQDESIEDAFDEATYRAGFVTNPMAGANFHIGRALTAALFGDQPALREHAAAAIPLLEFVLGTYSTTRAYLLQALALAGAARAAAPAELAPLVDELDECRAWLAARAVDAPGNFAHLVALIDAERAWAVGDLQGAVAGYDAALHRLGDRQRPWHRALICERSALFALSQGHEYQARQMLTLARDSYARWGASAKVDQLSLQHPFLRTVRTAGPGVAETRVGTSLPGVSTDSMDLLAVLEASQALSSETDLDQLRVRVVDVLTAMTGATGVTVLLWSEAVAGWVLPSDDPTQPALRVQDAGTAGKIPLSAFRYAERTRQPLLVTDATTDDRFAADPYLIGARCCSLLVVPILSQGRLRVMLVLENQLQRSAFSSGRLDAVLLIAGQLAVSFDNARARRLAEQEADRRLRLLETLRQRERLLETLLAIQRDIAHRAPLQQVLDSVTMGASVMLGGDYVALVLADPLTPDEPRIPSISGRAAGHERDSLVLSIATEAIALDKLVARIEPDEGHGLIAAPVHASGEIIGSLVTGAGSEPGYRTERNDLLSAFAEQVSLALNDANTLQAMREASYDSLTGLASRPLFLDRLRQTLKAGARRGDEVTVLFIDLGRFKAVNDTLGHKAGDDLLAGVADRLRGCIREVDIAARLGGDEFAVLLEGTDGPAGGLLVADKVLESLQEPFRVSGQDVFVSASIGISHGRASDCGATELLGRADVAMYRAKKEGSVRAVVFEPQMHVEVAERLELQGALQSAVGTKSIWVEYQPLMSLRTGRPSGVEALVRWTHPQRGQISPVTFIPIAEETGVIVDLGRWVLLESCRQAAHWRETSDPNLGLSVNVSGRQLVDGRFADDVEAALAESGMPAHALTLELTETVLMDDPAMSVQRLSELKRLGVRLAIDDFGTGYSSLAYLRQFPVDELKIDKSFIDTIGQAEADLAIVRTVVELARILGLHTTAEGIESKQQADLLHRLGCESAQGYHFARPMDSRDVAGFLARHQSPPASP
jgi:diguanylate cyclase (GGDEF)-like protein